VADREKKPFHLDILRSNCRNQQKERLLQEVRGAADLGRVVAFLNAARSLIERLDEVLRLIGDLS
jgi:hypothetical protein